MLLHAWSLYQVFILLCPLCSLGLMSSSLLSVRWASFSLTSTGRACFCVSHAGWWEVTVHKVASLSVLSSCVVCNAKVIFTSLLVVFDICHYQFHNVNNNDGFCFLNLAFLTRVDDQWDPTSDSLSQCSAVHWKTQDKLTPLEET